MAERIVLFLASSNAHKAQELETLAQAGGGGFEIRSAQVWGGMPAVAEDTGTFAGNARKKAQALRARVPAGAWALADDSGLCVAALGGAPGVESAYYAGPHGDPAANLAKLIRELRDVPAGRRQADFVCVLLAIGPDGREHMAEGRCAGTLLDRPRGHGGFGYDPLFVPEGRTASLAELGAAEKNRLSHRARAWARLAPDLAAATATARHP